MWVYIETEKDQLWTVGFYQPADPELESGYKWCPIRDCESERAAAQFTNYLNGGQGNTPPVAMK